ncbi:MAG: BMP family protein, partial [Microcoleaceae cyanobacterium]
RQFIRTSHNFLLMLTTTSLIKGCQTNERSPTLTKPKKSDFQVAMLLPGALSEDPWSQAGHRGLLLIEKELGAEIAYTDKIASNATDIFRQYAKAKYDLVIGQGGEYAEAAEKVAQEFPRIKFAIFGNHAGNNENFGALGFKYEEQGYILGVMAAIKSRSQKVTIIGGEPLPHMKITSDFFMKGAKSIQPNIQATAKWINSWTDVVKAEQLALEAIQAGYDVLVGNVDAGNAKIFQLAEKYGVYGISAVNDAYDIAPKAIVGSLVQEVPLVLLKGASIVRQGRWEGKQYRFGFQEGIHTLAPFRSGFTSTEQAHIQSILQDILTGKIDLYSTQTTS